MPKFALRWVLCYVRTSSFAKLALNWHLHNALAELKEFATLVPTRFATLSEEFFSSLRTGGDRSSVDRRCMRLDLIRVPPPFLIV